MRLIEQVLEAGRGALVLVPEIALTPQLVERFRDALRRADRRAALRARRRRACRGLAGRGLRARAAS